MACSVLSTLLLGLHCCSTYSILLRLLLQQQREKVHCSVTKLVLLHLHPLASTLLQMYLQAARCSCKRRLH